MVRSKKKKESEWIFIDEGNGDRFNLCQSNYFENGLYTEDGFPRYKYEDGKVVLRTDEEIESDRQVIPAPAPTEDELQWQAITDIEISQMEYAQALTELEIAQLEGGTN